MAENKKRASAENITKGTSGDKQEKGLHPLKGTVKENNYKDNDSSNNRLEGLHKEKLENQLQIATNKFNKRIADNIQNSEHKEQ
jgi:hypothetical protein